MDDQYQTATDWIEQIGQGVLEEGDDIKTWVTKLCPFYYLINEVMWDQASECPLALSQMLDSEDEDDSNSWHSSSDGSMQDDPAPSYMTITAEMM